MGRTVHIRCVVVVAGIVALALTAAPTAGAQPAPDDNIRCETYNQHGFFLAAGYGELW